MKKNIKLIMLFLFSILSVFVCTNVYAKDLKISLEDVKLAEKNGEVTVSDIEHIDYTVNSDIKFKNKDDYIILEVELKNNSSEDYTIVSINDNNTLNNLNITYDFNEEFKAGESYKFKIKLLYNEKVVNRDSISLSDLKITLNIMDSEGEIHGEDIINPTTGDGILHYLGLFVISIIGVVLLIKKTAITIKNKKYKVGIFVLLLALIILPFSIFAVDEYKVELLFKNITLESEYLDYTVSFNTNGGNVIDSRTVTYGQPIGDLPQGEKNGYTFNNWKDNNGNTVTSSTIVTGELELTADFTPIEYDIHYDLNQGSAVTKDKYTIEDEFTLPTPTRLGYTFTGWSGTGISGTQLSVTISHETGEKSFTAHWSKNQNTRYYVDHKYETLNGDYVTETVEESGPTDDTVSAPVQPRTGFKTPTQKNVTITGDEQARVEYVYDREEYTFGVTDRTYLTNESTANGTYKYGYTVTLEAQERPGYTFKWSDDDTNYTKSFDMSSNTSLTPIYTANTNTKYYVDHKYQTLNGDYTTETVEESGTTDDTVNAPVQPRTGFVTPSLQQITITGDEQARVEYVYDRVPCTLTIQDADRVITETPSGTYPYGTEITLTAKDVDGLIFTGWSNGETTKTITFNIENENTTIKPLYETTTFTVQFDGNGGTSSEASITVNVGESIAELPTAERFNYVFDGWYTGIGDGIQVFDGYTPTASITLHAHWHEDPLPTVFKQTGECQFNGTNEISGADCDYDGQHYIDTGIQLYNVNNHILDYEIGFTIESYNSDDNVNQATFMNTKLEGDNYPGLVFRKKDNENRLDLSSRNTSSANKRVYRNTDEIHTVKIYRTYNESNDVQEIYYIFDDEPKKMINDLSSFNPIFNLNVWFGAAPTNASANSAQRYLNGTLSNMYIKLGYAQDDVSKYIVRFEANGGSVSPKQITKDKDEPVGTLPTPTAPSGKVFDGWYTDPTNGVKVDSTYMPNVNTVLYARYTEGTVTVTFNTDGGDDIASQTIKYGGKATRPSTDPTKEGYTFDNWYTTSNYDTVFDFTNTTITTNTTIFAKFNVIDTCNGFSTDSWDAIKTNVENDSDYYPVGCTRKLPLDINNDGVDENYTLIIVNTSECTSNYSESGCGFVIQFKEGLYIHSSNRRMRESKTNAGGWPASKVRTYLNETIFDMLPSDLKNVIKKTKTISSHGSGVTENYVALDDKLFLLSLREVGLSDSDSDTAYYNNRKLDYFREGDNYFANEKRKRVAYESNGLTLWWLRSVPRTSTRGFHTIRDTGTSLSEDANNDNPTIIPAFRIGTNPSYTVSFDTDGGDDIASQTIEYGEKVTIPSSEPTKVGYTFNGWYTSDTYETAFDFENTLITGETTIYAKMDINKYTVTFDTNGGSEVPSQTIDYGGKVTKPDDPIKEGLVFVNWYTNDGYNTVFNFNSRTITSDTTIYAKFATHFEVDSWDTIASNVRSYNTDMYHVGDTKKVTLSNIGTFDVRIANMSTPLECSNATFSRTACGFVVEFVNVIGDRRMYSSSISGGWTNSGARTYLTDTVYPALPSDLRNVIADTHTLAGNDGANAMTTTTDKLYLLSMHEIYENLNNYLMGTSGPHPYCFDNSYNYSRQLDYYSMHGVEPSKNKEYAIKTTLTGAAVIYWLRSAAYMASTYWDAVTKTGGPTYDTANSYRYISPAFRISDFHTVSFDTDGGTPVDDREIELGFAVGRLPITTKEGYGFAGWYEDPEFEKPITKDTIPTQDTIYYAKWVYNCNGFATDSWDTINTNLENNPDYYPIGCEKEVELDMNNDGVDESYTVRLSNTSRPEECSTDGYSQTACGTVIEFADLVTTGVMNSSNTNAGGWKSTGMVSWLNSTFYNKLPSDLKSIIIPTYPIVSGSGTDENSPDITIDDINKNKVYLLSLKEAGIASSIDNKSDKTRKLDYYYTYYTNSYRIKNLGDTATRWWLRTAASHYNYSFEYIDSSGTNYDYDANSSRGVAPVFRIGKNKYTIKFNANGGTVNVNSITKDVGDVIGELPTPIAPEGKTFDGWYTSISDGIKIDDTYLSPINVTVYAIYKDIDLCNGFSSDSWNTIVDNIKSDSNYYAIGCQKDIEMDLDDNGTNETYTVRLANTSTPEECSADGFSETACGTVIEFVDSVTLLTMNINDETNENGWPESAVHDYVNNTLLSHFPSELMDVLMLTDSVSGGPGDKVFTSWDFLYLLTAKEIGSLDDLAHDYTSGRTRTLDYYINHDENDYRLKKYNNEYDNWWLRSGITYTHNTFYFVTNNGVVGHSEAELAPYGVSPAFRIGDKNY